MPLLQITNGVTRHPDYRLAEPLNLTIEAGEALAICGPNGGGKSLLVDIITGAHPLLAMRHGMTLVAIMLTAWPIMCGL